MKKYKVAVEETSIVYYIVEAENGEKAMDIACSEGECCSSKPKQDEPLWAKECYEKNGDEFERDMRQYEKEGLLNIYEIPDEMKFLNLNDESELMERRYSGEIDSRMPRCPYDIGNSQRQCPKFEMMDDYTEGEPFYCIHCHIDNFKGWCEIGLTQGESK